MADAALLLNQMFDARDPEQLLLVSFAWHCAPLCALICLLQLQQRVRELTALGTGSYGRDLLV